MSEGHFAEIIPFSMGQGMARTTTGREARRQADPVEVDGVCRGLKVRRVYLGPGDRLPMRYEDLPSATIHRPRGEREVVISFGVTEDMRATMDADDAVCDRLGVDRTGWSTYEAEALALIRMGG